MYNLFEDAEIFLLQMFEKYQSSFSRKKYEESEQGSDLLMDIFKITNEMKNENKQYWGRELGMIWQKLVSGLCYYSKPNLWGEPIKIGKDEPCDLVLGRYAIDTKYRVGSGDSGTLKKFKTYGPLLRKKGYIPVMLFLREDNLPAAITACENGGWEIYQGDESFEFVKKKTGVDLKKWLVSLNGKYAVKRH
jgi:hypothetical protein